MASVVKKVLETKFKTGDGRHPDSYRETGELKTVLSPFRGLGGRDKNLKIVTKLF